MPNFRIRTVERAAAAALVSASLTACSGGPAAAPPAADDRLYVVTTFTVLADMVAEVGGARVRVESITKPGAEIHGYEPTPADLVRAQGADLVVDNGLGLEAWFAQLLAAVDAPHVTVSDGVDPQPITSGEAAGHPNPHAWMSPAAGQTYVANIADALASADPDGEAVYRANAAAYREQLEQIGDDLADAVAAVPERTRPGWSVAAVGTVREPFRTLAAELLTADFPARDEAHALASATDLARRLLVRTLDREKTELLGAIQRVPADSEEGRALRIRLRDLDRHRQQLLEAQ